MSYSISPEQAETTLWDVEDSLFHFGKLRSASPLLYPRILHSGSSTSADQVYAWKPSIPTFQSPQSLRPAESHTCRRLRFRVKHTLMLPRAVEQTDDAGKVEPPAKRRRGGRRSSNPDISTEERKRLRVLKNRESAMRSLAKKAEYSAKLVNMEKEAIAEYKSSRESLEKLVCNAVALRAALGKVPEDVEKLIADAEASINRGTSALAQADEDFEPAMPALPQESDDLPDQSASGDSAEG